MQQLVMWAGLDAQRMEVVELDLRASGLRARGTQIGAQPEPYRLDYALDAKEGFVTRTLDLKVTASSWSRRLYLRHDGRGHWSWSAEAAGRCGSPGPGAPRELARELIQARDCDLGLSPLTNLLPVRRLELSRPGSRADLVTAWVSVPDLELHVYPQSYAYVDSLSNGSLIRFIDRGLSAGFTADLQFDTDGVVELYPELARRLSAAP